MSGEDQERFEDYLELEHFIEELQAGRVAHPPVELTPSQARIYRMAALFRAASPEANEPRPEFAAELQARLEQELQLQQQPQQPQGDATPSPRLFQRQQGNKQEQRKRPNGVSRRALLTGGAAVAASLAIGTGLGAAVNHTLEPTASPSPTPTKDDLSFTLIGEGVPTVWHLVTTLAELGNTAIRFTTNAVIGYVIRDSGEDNDPDKGQIIAMSAACTHMGCIVQWKDSDRKFHCPCHGGLFTEYGQVDWGASAVRYVSALSRLKTKVENGNVYVEVPASQK